MYCVERTQNPKKTCIVHVTCTFIIIMWQLLTPPHNLVSPPLPTPTWRLPHHTPERIPDNYILIH